MTERKIYHYILTYVEICIYTLLSIVYGFHSFIVWALVPRKIRRREVTGQLALVTGGALGLGKEIAKQLAAKGAKVIIWDINSKSCEETQEEIRREGNECFCYTVDVTDYKAVSQMAKTVKEEHGMVEILVNNAGILGERDLLTDSEEFQTKILHVNTLGCFWTVKAFLPDMKKAKRGHIVNMSSLCGLLGNPKNLAYTASKAALCAFDETLRFELNMEGLSNINMSLICPFYIDTRMSKGVQASLYPNLSIEYVAKETIDAILMNRRRVLLPPGTLVMAAMKGLIHHKALSLMSRASVGADPMATTVWATAGKKMD